MFWGVLSFATFYGGVDVGQAVEYNLIQGLAVGLRSADRTGAETTDNVSN